MSCAALVRPQRGAARLGRLVDLSTAGAGVVTLSAVPPETPVSVMVDVATGGWEHLPLLQGVIRGIETSDGTSRLHRLSIAFAALSADQRVIMQRLLEASESSPAPLPPELCERLLAGAFEHLAARRFASARQAISRALKAEPDNVAYRVVQHRIEAEEALAYGGYVKASREVALGLVRARRDPELNRLRVQLDAMRDAWLKRQR